MRNMFKPKYFTGWIVLSVLLVSCSKKDSYNVKGDEGVKFFTNNGSFGNAPLNSISYAVVNHPNPAGNGLLNLSTTIPTTVKIPVYASKPVCEDVIIKAELDNSLIAAYNTANGTNYLAFPAGILKADGLTAKIAKGTTTSVDSITIATDFTGLNTMTEPAYMAPIKLTTVSDPKLGAITTTHTKIAYIVANMEFRQIKYLATTADVQGTLISPRSSWTVNIIGALATTGSITDGSTTTFSRWNASPGDIDINLQTTQNITGLRLYTSNNGTHIPTQMDVWLSNDGINYSLVGSPLRANLTYASSYNYILFYKAIPAKYIRLRLYYTTSTNTQNRRITELDVYAN